jgi:hypothetical protein
MDEYLEPQKAVSKENSRRVAAKLFLIGMVLCGNRENVKFMFAQVATDFIRVFIVLNINLMKILFDLPCASWHSFVPRPWAWIETLG